MRYEHWAERNFGLGSRQGFEVWHTRLGRAVDLP